MANPDVQSNGLAALSIIEGLDENGHIIEGEETITGLEIIDRKHLQ